MVCINYWTPPPVGYSGWNNFVSFGNWMKLLRQNSGNTFMKFGKAQQRMLQSLSCDTLNKMHCFDVHINHQKQFFILFFISSEIGNTFPSICQRVQGKGFYFLLISNGAMLHQSDICK